MVDIKSFICLMEVRFNLSCHSCSTVKNAILFIFKPSSQSNTKSVDLRLEIKKIFFQCIGIFSIFLTVQRDIGIFGRYLCMVCRCTWHICHPYTPVSVTAEPIGSVCVWGGWGGGRELIKRQCHEIFI